MKILGIDTSTRFLSVAIINNNDIAAEFNDRSELKHSSLIMPAIDGVLKKSDTKLRNIDAIALSIGPGSFTGLRIGVATCKGINLALGIPVIAVPTLDVIAYNFINEPIRLRSGFIPSDQRESRDEKERLLSPLIDAKKQKVYACFYEKLSPDPYPSPEPSPLWGKGRVRGLERLTDYMLLDIKSLLEKIDKPTLVFGDGVKLYGEYCKKNPFISISDKDWHPKAALVAKLGLVKALKRQFANPDKLVPMYLHSKYCQVKI